MALAAAGIAVHPLLFAAGGVGIAIFATWVVRSRQYMRQRIVALENQIRDQELAASDQLTTLSVLSSELRLDEVLDRISASASNAIGGAGFVLLQARDGCMVADRAEIPPSIARRLEQWAQTHRDSLGRRSIMVDDLARVAELEALATDPQMPLGSASSRRCCLGASSSACWWRWPRVRRRSYRATSARLRFTPARRRSP